MPKITELQYAEPWIEVASTPADWKKVGQAGLLRMVYYLHVIRSFEETVLSLEKVGLVHGPAHSSIGQEGGAVAPMMLLNSTDMITGSHRGHHQFLAKGMRHIDRQDYDPRKAPIPNEVENFLYRTLAEILGLSDGFCKGRGGSMHLRWVEAGAMGTNAIVGGGVPIANGLAWAQKRRNKGEVTFTFFGDGGMNIGASSRIDESSCTLEFAYLLFCRKQWICSFDEDFRGNQRNKAVFSRWCIRYPCISCERYGSSGCPFSFSDGC